MEQVRICNHWHPSFLSIGGQNPPKRGRNTTEYIENHVHKKLTVEELAGELYISASHLQRLFKLGTGQSIIEYARGRRLARSLEQLYDENLRILDIAGEFGFEHEQSYIHAFRAEYGRTPGNARKYKHSLPIREKISFVNVNDFGTLYGPDLVMSPRRYIVGKPFFFPAFEYELDAVTPSRLAMQFIEETMPFIPNIIQPPIYIGFGINHTKYDLEYMPGVPVEHLKRVPPGLTGKELSPCLCARFIYMGEHSFAEINMTTAFKMYDAMLKFWKEQTRYTRADNTFYEKVESILIDGKYCLMERYLPVLDNHDVSSTK